MGINRALLGKYNHQLGFAFSTVAYEKMLVLDLYSIKKIFERIHGSIILNPHNIVLGI